MWDRRDGELFTYAGIAGALYTVGTPETEVLAEVVSYGISEGEVEPDSFLNEYDGSIEIPVARLGDSSNDITDEQLEEALEYLSDQPDEERGDRSMMPDGRALDIEDGNVELPPATLVRLGDIMVGVQYDFDLAYRHEIESLRDEEVLSGEDTFFLGRFTGDPGLVERQTVTKEDSEDTTIYSRIKELFSNGGSSEFYSFRNERLGNALFESGSRESSLNINFENGEFKVSQNIAQYLRSQE